MPQDESAGPADTAVASDELSTRDTLIDLAFALRGGAAPEPARFRDLPFRVGRYVVTQLIGRGAAGLVFRATDPELAREVAIKLVVPHSRNDRTRAELLGEAQAIAKLSHPNVVAVYDVGMLSPDDDGSGAGIYMVMELLAGVSLRAWLSARTPSVNETLDVLLAAGRGLEAAHHAGLVHRDFKPENVLVSDNGRVHVLDFGLALADAGTPSGRESVVDGRAPNEIAGTPAYMAPEQHAGASNDARADLFAFCATCWEALHGVLPYRGRTLDQLARTKGAGCGSAPTRRPPRWLHDIIARGLAPDPERRPASMTTLLAEIEGRRHRRRNVTIGALAFATSAGALALVSTRGPDAQACIAGGHQRLDAAWNDDARGLARARFDDADLPYAEETWGRVEAVLDERAAAWRTVQAQACEGALDASAGAVEQAALVLGCLDGQLDELGARVEVFAHADRDVVRQAGRMAERMPRPERCLDARRVAAEHDGSGGELEAELLRGRLLYEVARFDESLAVAQRVEAAAAEAGDHRRRARALLLACRSDGRGHIDVGADVYCTDAWVEAERARADTVVVSAMLEVLGKTAPEQEREAQRIERLLRAKLDARPPEEHDAGLESDLALAVSQRRREAGRWQESRVEAQRAYDIAAESRGPEDPGVVSALNELALAAEVLGELDRARELFAEASEILLATRGRAHPDVVSLENNVAGLEIALGRHADALERLGRVLDAKRALDGDRSVWLLTTMYQQVEAHVALGHGAAALEIARAMLELAESIHGVGSGELLPSLVGLTWALRASDRCTEALDVVDRMVAISAGVAAPDPETRAVAELERARCLEALGRSADAGVGFARAVVQFEELYGADGRAVAKALLERARWELAHGSTALAHALLDRAAKICTMTEGDPALTRRVAEERERLAR
jgi:tetratricopeptide (TPR) repeat protein